MAVPDLQPDELEALQAEDPGPDPLIRVDIARVEVPIRTQDLPRKAGATFNKSLTAGTGGPGTGALRLLRSDHRRAQARVMSVGQNIYIAYSEAMAGDLSKMALWPANVPFIFSIDGDLWVASASGTTTVSVITELWAVGE